MAAALGTIRLGGNDWHIDTRPDVAIRLKRVFERVGKQQFGTLKIRDTPEVCRDLRWFCARYPHDVEPRDHLDRHADEHERTETDVAALLTGDLRPEPVLLALPLRHYQEVAVELAKRTKGVLVADELGLGKTATAIGVLADQRARPALVVCLPHLQAQWKREIEKFAPGLDVHVLKSGRPYDVANVHRRAGRRRRAGPTRTTPARFPDVLVSTYSKLSGWADVLAGRIRGVVFDEAQELRTGFAGGSARYAAAHHIARGAEYRLGLSATPIYNYGVEFHSVLECIRPGALGTIHEFLREWCTCTYGETRKARLADPPAFGQHIRSSGVMIRRTRSDVARELPAVTPILQTVDADPATLDQVAPTVAELARVILAQGGRSWDKKKAAGDLDRIQRRQTGIAKAGSVATFVRMLAADGEKKIVLFGWHRAVYDIWCTELADLRPVMYTGSESPTAKERARRAFVEGDANILIISLRAGAGLDGLQGVCRTVVFGELDWSPGVHAQCVGRVHRDGQSEPVFAYYLIADRGSDPVVADVLGLKQGQIQPVLEPGGDLVEKLEIDTDRLQRLARAVLDDTGGV